MLTRTGAKLLDFGVAKLAPPTPFVADSATGVIAAILERDPPPLTLPESGAARAVEQLLQHCLKKAPDDAAQSSCSAARRAMPPGTSRRRTT